MVNKILKTAILLLAFTPCYLQGKDNNKNSGKKDKKSRLEWTCQKGIEPASTGQLPLLTLTDRGDHVQLTFHRSMGNCTITITDSTGSILYYAPWHIEKGEEIRFTDTEYYPYSVTIIT